MGWKSEVRIGVFKPDFLTNGIFREVIESRIATYPPGSLEFSLLALHDDPLPILQEQMVAAQTTGDQSLVVELMDKISDENAKRERWAVSDHIVNFPPSANILPV